MTIITSILMILYFAQDAGVLFLLAAVIILLLIFASLGNWAYEADHPFMRLSKAEIRECRRKEKMKMRTVPLPKLSDVEDIAPRSYKTLQQEKEWNQALNEQKSRVLRPKTPDSFGRSDSPQHQRPESPGKGVLAKRFALKLKLPTAKEQTLIDFKEYQRGVNEKKKEIQQQLYQQEHEQEEWEVVDVKNTEAFPNHH